MSETIVPKFEKYLPKYKLGEKVNIILNLYSNNLISQLNNLIKHIQF